MAQQFIIGSAVLTPNLANVPSFPQLAFTQGDTVTLNLFAQDAQGNPINLTGASFSTKILGPSGGVATFGNTQHAIVNAGTGQFQLALANTDTQLCAVGQNKSIITAITIAGATISFQGNGLLSVLNANPDF